MARSPDNFYDDFHAELGDLDVELRRIEDLGVSVGNTLSRSLGKAILEGRDLRSLLSDIGNAFSKIALDAALKPVGDLASGFVQNLFTATNPALNGITPFAKGGVIATPSYFPLSNGVGLAGEAGPEAILPLVRGSDGRLGVGGGQAPISISMRVEARDARSFVGAEAEVSAMLLRAVKRGQRAS